MLKYFVFPSEKIINVSPKLILKTVRNNIPNYSFFITVTRLTSDRLLYTVYRSPIRIAAVVYSVI